jgi:hypothetical protein
VLIDHDKHGTRVYIRQALDGRARNSVLRSTRKGDISGSHGGRH